MDGNRTDEPDDILQTLSETPERFAEKGRLLIAIKLFELGHIATLNELNNLRCGPSYFYYSASICVHLRIIS